MASLQELKERCRALGLSSGGNKMQLIRRINAHQAATTVESSPECECEAQAIIAKPIKLQGDDEMISEARLVPQNASQQDRLQSENFRGNVFVGNEGGLRYADKTVQADSMEEQLLSVKQRLSNLEAERLVERDERFVERNRLLERIEVLEKSSSTLSEMRNRFLTFYKRDKMRKELDASDEAFIAAGNATAHGGNAKYDAKLYDGGRKDYNVYTKIYGLHPAVVSTLHDETTILVLDQYASDTSSRFKEVTAAYEQAFQDFLRALIENNNAPVPLNEPLSELTQCYWKFFDRVKIDVIEKGP